ncbi:unnamed protein product [Durusdinium trenchii]|uniref:Uncharacterized protein n=2 Tax=Durusdinium trenchii TaxID=1381693 RepID=A0ABP0L1G3_9DINO
MFGRARRASLLAAIFFATETSRPFLVPKDTRRGVLATGVVTVVAEHVASASAEDKNSAEKAVEAAASQLSLGQRGDELVLPAWFGGEWACFGELYKVESSSRTKEFNAALPGALEFVKKNQEAVGTEAGNFRARRRWQPSGRPAPGGGKGVLEDRAGLAAGAVAAAYTLGGPTPRLKPQGDDFLVADRWRLTPAGAVARADPEEEELKALRVSELFEVRQKDQEKLAAAVRVVTLWKQAPLPEEAKKTLDTSRKLMQAIQTVYLLPDPSAAATKNFASMTTRFVYSPIRS